MLSTSIVFTMLVVDVLVVIMTAEVMARTQRTRLLEVMMHVSPIIFIMTNNITMQISKRANVKLQIFVMKMQEIIRLEFSLYKDFFKFR